MRFSVLEDLNTTNNHQIQNLKFSIFEIGFIRKPHCNLSIDWSNFETSKNNSCEITIPEDVLVGKSINDKSKVKELDNIKDDDLILDIGPKTINKIQNIIKDNTTLDINDFEIIYEPPVSFLSDIVPSEVLTINEQRLVLGFEATEFGDIMLSQKTQIQ